MREGSRIARTARGPIEFAEIGEGPPVLVVHGAGGGIAPRPGAGASGLPAPPLTSIFFDTALRSDLLFWSALRVARRLVVRALLATPPADVDAASEDERRRIDEILEHILPVSERRLGLLNDARITSTLQREPLEQVTAKTVVMSVADDLFGTYEVARYTSDHIAGARFVGYERGGHVWVGHHEDVVDEVARFLEV